MTTATPSNWIIVKATNKNKISYKILFLSENNPNLSNDLYSINNIDDYFLITTVNCETYNCNQYKYGVPIEKIEIILSKLSANESIEEVSIYDVKL